MKKRITAVILAIALMALIPMFIVKNSAFEDIGKAIYSDKEIKTNLTEAMLYEYREEYCDNGLKALGIILNSQIKAGKSPKTADRESFIKKYGDDTYKKLNKISESVNGEYAVYKEKALALPYSYLSKGLKKYGNNSCNPWDRLKKDYKTAKNGISLNSVNKLCENGLTAEEALLSFLSEKVQILKQ